MTRKLPTPPEPDEAESTEPDQVVVFLVGASRGHKHGDQVTTTPDVAASLVANGLAR